MVIEVLEASMVIEVIDKVLDRLIELAKLRKQTRKEKFQALVQETYTEFEAIHQHYVQCFRSYRTRLADGTDSLQAIMDAIREECLFTEHQRSKLREWSGLLAAENTQFSDFFSAIYSYLTATHDIERTTFPPDYLSAYGQRWFTGLVDTLAVLDLLIKGSDADGGQSSISRQMAREALEREGDERKAAVHLVNAYTNWLQNCFSRVSEEYAKLKRDSL